MSSKRGRKGRPGQHQKPEAIFELNDAQDRLRDVFDRYGASWITHEQTLKFAKFYRLLMTTQMKENFTRLLNLRDIGIKHFIDSAIVVQVLREHSLDFPERTMDMGTGPGFPGVPLAIVRPSTSRFLLAEGVQRRVEFLKSVRDELGFSLDRVGIIGRNINRSCFYPVDAVITRAVEEAVNTLENCQYCVQKGGRVILMKGPNCDPELDHFSRSEMQNYFKLAHDISYQLPNTTHDRRLLIFEKTAQSELPTFDELDALWDKDSPNA